MGPRVDGPSAEPLGRLLATKLAPPPPRPLRVARRRLTDQLDKGLDQPLILVAAPAGFGKTTLVADWLATSTRRPSSIAWLALDEADNDPARFWRYVIGAIQSAHNSVGATALALLRVAGSAAPEQLVDELVPDLAALEEPLLLVLDDYHVITAPAVHRGLSYFLDRLPPTVRLIVSTRSDPLFPLARLRARAHVTEIRARDLRFTADESAAFLADVMGLPLSRDQVAVLETRTEGWAAGLQLAGLSLQGRADDADRAAFVDAFGGSHRFVVDYLVDEVLLRQPERVGSFLLRTSILDRLSGPLCEAVTGEPDSQALLEDVERANLFLIPLDDERRWYRYHHLFADVLRHRLRAQLPDQAQLLHRRASAWCSANGLGQHAVEHALAAGDWQSSSELIDSQLWQLHARGERETVRRWLLQIPEDARQELPLVRISLGHSWLSAGEFDKAAGIVESLHDLAAADGETVARALLLEANLANQRGDPARTIACAERALTLLPTDSLRTRASAAVLLESAYLARGDLRAAERVFAETQPTPDQLVIDWLLRSDRAVLDALRGRLHDAALTHRAILREIGDLPVVYAVEQHYRLAVLHCEWSELGEAEQSANEALARADRAHAAVFVPRIQLVRAQLAMARGDLSLASQCIGLAEAAAERIGNVVQRRWACAMRARVDLLRQDLAAASAWASLVSGAEDLDAIEREPEALALARVDLARGDARQALVTLTAVLDRALATGCESSVIRAVVGRAATLAASGHVERALAALEDALRRAEPGGFRRVFLDDGPALTPLLRRTSSPLGRSLLATLERSSSGSLVSAREQEVLVLVAQGLSNRDIAERLVVTPNTVKAHLRHLGTKLGTSSRTQLLAAARQSGLLP